MYSNDGLSRNYGTGTNPSYPETAYGFMRFRAEVGKINVVGFDHLNPQLQERVIPTNVKPGKPWHGNPHKYDRGRPGSGHRNQSARPWEK